MSMGQQCAVRSQTQKQAVPSAGNTQSPTAHSRHVLVYMPLPMTGEISISTAAVRAARDIIWFAD